MLPGSVSNFMVSSSESKCMYFYGTNESLFIHHLDVQDHMAGEAKSLSPRQCAVMDVALDTIKVSLYCGL